MPVEAEFAAVGTDNDEEWMFTDGHGTPIDPHALSQTFRCRGNDRRNTA